MAFDYKYHSGLFFIFCSILSITHQSYEDPSFYGSIGPPNKSLFEKLHAMEKSALAKKLEGAGLQGKEKSVLAKALKGTELKSVEKSVLDKAMKEAGLQELEKSALTKAGKGTSKNFSPTRGFGNENESEKIRSESDTNLNTPDSELTTLSNEANLQLLYNESFFVSFLLNKSLGMEKDNGTDDSNSTVLNPAEITSNSSISNDLISLIQPQNETNKMNLTSNLQKSVQNSSKSPLDLELVYRNEYNLKDATTTSRVNLHGQNNSTETPRDVNVTEAHIKDSMVSGSHKKMEINFNDKKLVILLRDIDPWHYLPEAKITVLREKSWDRIDGVDIVNLNDLGMYEGTVENISKAHVIGSVVNGLFNGYIFKSGGELLFVDNSTVMATENLNSIHNDPGKCKDGDGLCHDLSLMETYDCVPEGKYGISCFFGKGKVENGTSFKENSTKSYHPQFVPKHKTNVYCSVSLESHPSHFVDSHNKNVADDVREILLAFLFTNHILQHTDLNGDGEGNNVHLRLASIKLHDDNGTRLGEKMLMGEELKRLSKEPQDTCLTLRFVSQELQKGEPLSVGFRGGMCMDNINQTEPAESVAVINLRQPEGELSKFAASWVTLKTIGQMMGSYKTYCKKHDPLTALKNWRKFFSRCEGHNIAETLVLRGFCLKNVPALRHRLPEGGDPTMGMPVCGDGIVDIGEECDCGKVMECKKKRHCCVPPGRTNQCKIDRSKGYECSINQACCSATCKIIPESMHVFCGGGDPECSSQQAFCSGKSADCPVVAETTKAFDEKTCGRGQLGVCSGGSCTYPECVKNGWPDCRCNASQQLDCRVCCEKEGECLPALYLDLPQPMTLMFRKMGTLCGEEMDGKCNAYGECVLMKQLRSEASKVMESYFTINGLCISLVDFVICLFFIYSLMAIFL